MALRSFLRADPGQGWSASINLSHRVGAFEGRSRTRSSAADVGDAGRARRPRHGDDRLTSFHNKRPSTVARGRGGRAASKKVSVLVLDVEPAREEQTDLRPEQILSDMGRLLKRSARTTDCIAGYGYDEFGSSCRARTRTGQGRGRAAPGRGGEDVRAAAGRRCTSGSPPIRRTRCWRRSRHPSREGCGGRDGAAARDRGTREATRAEEGRWNGR